MEKSEMKKFKYESPKILDLGEIAIGKGIECMSGSSASPYCSTGNNPTGDCPSPGAAASRCDNGGTPTFTGACSTGTGD